MVKLIKLILVLGLVIGAVYLAFLITGRGDKFGKEVQKETVETVKSAERMKQGAEMVKDRAEDSIRRSELISNTINSDKE